MDTLYSELVSLVFTSLQLDCPVMSGNMQHHITYEEVGTNFCRICVSGPSYDFNKWKTTGVIEHTGEYDYAISVNEVGAFYGKSKKSKHWANKSIVNSCQMIAGSHKAEVIIDVEL